MKIWELNNKKNLRDILSLTNLERIPPISIIFERISPTLSSDLYMTTLIMYMTFQSFARNSFSRCLEKMTQNVPKI